MFCWWDPQPSSTRSVRGTVGDLGPVPTLNDPQQWATSVQYLGAVTPWWSRVDSCNGRTSRYVVARRVPLMVARDVADVKCAFCRMGRNSRIARPGVAFWPPAQCSNFKGSYGQTLKEKRSCNGRASKVEWSNGWTSKVAFSPPDLQLSNDKACSLIWNRAIVWRGALWLTSVATWPNVMVARQGIDPALVERNGHQQRQPWSEGRT